MEKTWMKGKTCANICMEQTQWSLRKHSQKVWYCCLKNVMELSLICTKGSIWDTESLRPVTANCQVAFQWQRWAANRRLVIRVSNQLRSITVELKVILLPLKHSSDVRLQPGFRYGRFVEHTRIQLFEYSNDGMGIVIWIKVIDTKIGIIGVKHDVVRMMRVFRVESPNLLLEETYPPKACSAPLGVSKIRDKRARSAAAFLWIDSISKPDNIPPVFNFLHDAFKSRIGRLTPYYCRYSELLQEGRCAIK